MTGFVGVVLGYTVYSTGCIHYGLQAKAEKGKAPKDWEWFDQSRLEITKAKRITFDIAEGTTSGPFPDAPQN